MKTDQLTRWLSVISCFLAISTAWPFPVQVPYSGQLAENGELVNGTRTMKFQIIGTDSTPMWESTDVAVSISNGVFSVLLGGPDTSPIDSAVFNVFGTRLRIQVNGVVLSPDQPVHFTPYSVRSTSSQFADTASSVTANAITRASIAPGAVSLSQIDGTAAMVDQVLAYDGLALHWRTPITSISAGAGMLGGGTSGAVALAVNFAGDGVANTASHSDHNHQTNTVGRQYVVQYRESDFEFVSRLMEEEGIYYFFRHDDGNHKMILGTGREGINHDGPGLEIQAGAGAGTNRNGGNIILQPGTATGTGTPGAVRFSFWPRIGQEVVVTYLEGDPDQPIVIGRAYNDDSTQHHGTSIGLQAGDALGTGAEGGDILFEPGAASADGVPGQLLMQSRNNQTGINFAFSPGPYGAGEKTVLKIADDNNPVPQDRVIFGIDYVNGPSWRGTAQGTVANALALGGQPASFFVPGTQLVAYARLDAPSGQTFSGPAAFDGPVEFSATLSPPFSVGSNTALVPNLNAEFLDGVPATDYARLSTSNRFADSITFSKPTTHEKQAYFSYHLEDTLISGYTIGPSSEGLSPTESISLIFQAVQYKYGTNGIGAGFKMQAADGGTNGAGGDIQMKPGKGRGSGANGKFIVDSDVVVTGRVNAVGFTGDGSGLTGLSGASLATGTVPDALLSSNVARLDQSQTFLGTPTFAVSGGPPFSVGTNPGLVSNLNADLLDGKDSSDFALIHGSNYFTGPQVFTGSLLAGSLTVSSTISGAAARAAAANLGGMPSVANITVLLLQNYNVPTDITNLLDGIDGQVVVLVAGNNPAPPLVRDDNSARPGNFRLRNNQDWPALPNDTLTLCRVNGEWFETTRSDN